MKIGLGLVLVLNLCLVLHAQQQCPNAPSHPQDRRPNKNVLKIATYNAEWLFLNRSNCPGSGCAWPNKEAALKHMQDVADEIKIINADIVNLAEVQDCIVLTDLNKMLGGMNYLPYLLTGTDTATGQNVALLTRVDPSVNLQRTSNRVNYPVPGSTCGTSTGDSAVSKHYYTTFQIDGLPNPLTIFGLHFLAFPDDKSRCLQREAQASVIQSLVASYITQGHSVVVMGDMNDFDGSALDAAGDIPISLVLDILRDPLPNNSGDELINVASYISQQSQRYSYWYDEDSSCTVGPKELTAIDHLLITKDLSSLVDIAYMDHSYPPQCDTFESDHWPVIVQLDLSGNTTKLH